MIILLVIVGSLLVGFLLYQLLTAMFPTTMKTGWLHEPTFTVEDVKAVSYMMIDSPFTYKTDSFIKLQIEKFCNEQGFKSAVNVYGNSATGFCFWYQEKTLNLESHRRLKIRNGGVLQQAQEAEGNKVAKPLTVESLNKYIEGAIKKEAGIKTSKPYRKLSSEEIKEAVKNLHPDSDKIYMLDFSPKEEDSKITMVTQAQQGISEAEMIKAFSWDSYIRDLKASAPSFNSEEEAREAGLIVGSLYFQGDVPYIVLQDSVEPAFKPKKDA
jgi:hypothetical protein